MASRSGLRQQPAFTIASSDLVLLNPGRGTRAANGGVMRVAWKASAAVTGVNIFVKAGAGAETQVATNVTGTTFKDITLPPAVSSSSRVTIRIQDSGASARQDSVDGYFMVRGATPSFTTNLANRAPDRIGSAPGVDRVHPLYTVDLDLIGATTTSIARNLPDFGSYTWFVPDAVDERQDPRDFQGRRRQQVGLTTPRHSGLPADMPAPPNEPRPASDWTATTRPTRGVPAVERHLVRPLLLARLQLRVAGSV